MRPRAASQARWFLVCLVALIGACDGASGASTDDPDEYGKPGQIVPGDGAEDFVSDVPGQSSGGRDASDAGGTGGAEAPAAGGDAERAIAEADIIKVDGDTLYALSRYAGLNIIDISDPKRLRVLGNHRSNAMPFEMYLENGVAYIMYNDYGTYVFDEASSEWTWQSASRMQALDVSNPARITRIADEEVPGNISDSRLVGDIIYLVTYENGWCWRCEKPSTRVVSFDISNHKEFKRVDELRFDGDENSYQRSISVNQSRIYVAGPTWEDRDSTIQVVDISDPKGDLTLGAEIPIHGSVQNRWQMDEHEGVLRVISQPTAWRTDDPPYVQTFSVVSSKEITALASLAVKLPRPESLQSVRFDGDRGYAVTFEQTDPLFTFDLSDPATPKQMGELEIPGFVIHMEPRGDRIYALGYDQGNDQGSLHVSIFDVSKLDKPTMLDRVNFGGDWAYVGEDQDRIHKAFNIMLDAGLILVPFGGGSWDERSCHYEYLSGIQIIDVAEDDLTLRGVAPQLGEARRSLLHRNYLFGVTDNAVQVFDISDRDKPRKQEQLEVARNINQVKVIGDKLMRFGTDWWTNRATLDFTTLSNAATAAPLGELDLSQVAKDEKDECHNSSYWEGQVYVHGETAYVPRRSYHNWEENGKWRYEEGLTFYIVDLRDRDAPKLAGSFAISHSEDEYLGGVVLTDHALLVGRGKGYYYYDPDTKEHSEAEYSYDVYDLANPLAPRLTKRFKVPSQVAYGGWGHGAGGCGMDMGWGWWFPGQGASGALVSGDLVVSQHEESVDDGTGRVRYYLDRLDVSDPTAPKLLPPINIPGQVVHFDGKNGRAATLDYVYSETSATKWEDCYDEGNAYFHEESNTCRVYSRRINALTLDDDKATRVSMLLLDNERLSSFVSLSDERVFYTSYERGAVSRNRPPKTRLEALAYTSKGQFRMLESVPLEQAGWWFSDIVARGTRAFVPLNGSLAVIDTSDAEAAPTLKKHDMQGWGCSSIDVHGDRAYCALGMFGVATVDLD